MSVDDDLSCEESQLIVFEGWILRITLGLETLDDYFQYDKKIWLAIDKPGFSDSYNDFRATINDDSGFGDSQLSMKDLIVMILKRWFSIYDPEFGDSGDNFQQYSLVGYNVFSHTIESPRLGFTISQKIFLVKFNAFFLRNQIA